MTPALSIFCYLVVGTALLSSGIFLAASWALKRRDTRRIEMAGEILRLQWQLRVAQAEIVRLSLLGDEVEAELLAARSGRFLDRQPSLN